jgi:hypothetical protein
MEGAVATTSQSEVHQDYQAQQQLQAIENGQNPWESRDGPNERLLRLARATAVQREKPRIQVGACVSVCVCVCVCVCLCVCGCVWSWSLFKKDGDVFLDRILLLEAKLLFPIMFLRRH